MASGDVVWIVTEQSEAGESLVGAFASMDTARAAVSAIAGDRLADYRIEGRVLDESPPSDLPWVVELSRAGEHLGTRPFIGCASCGDEAVQYQRASVLSEGGERLSLVVLAATPGQALAAAQEQRTRWLEAGLWGDEAAFVPPIAASDLAAARS